MSWIFAKNACLVTWWSTGVASGRGRGWLVSVVVGTDETTNATGSVLEYEGLLIADCIELWGTNSYYKIKNRFFFQWFSYWSSISALMNLLCFFFQLDFFCFFFIWYSYVCDMVLTCFLPVSFFDVFHVTCFTISLSGQYFNQLSPYFCRHFESASKGSVVLATAPKQHCNVEWFHPPRVGRIIDIQIQKYMFVFFVSVCVAVCKMLKLTCGPKNGCNTPLWCLGVACAGAVGVVRCSWIAWSRDGCFNFTRGLPPWTMDQPNKTRHVINDIQHTINLLDGCWCGVLPILYLFETCSSSEGICE